MYGNNKKSNILFLEGMLELFLIIFLYTGLYLKEYHEW